MDAGDDSEVVVVVVADRAKTIDSVQHTLSRLMRASNSRSTFARQAAAIGATLTQPAYVLMRTLLDGGPLAMGELSRRSQMDVGMATRQVAALVEKGLVERRPDPADGRVTLVCPTDKGAQAGQALRDVRTRHLERALSDWSAVDLSRLDELLLRFHADTARTPFDAG